MGDSGLGGAQHQACSASITDIQSLPLDRVMAAQGAVNRKLGGFSPWDDGGIMACHLSEIFAACQNPFDPVAPEVSADVLVLIGFNRTELTLFAVGDPAAFSLLTRPACTNASNPSLVIAPKLQSRRFAATIRTKILRGCIS